MNREIFAGNIAVLDVLFTPDQDFVGSASVEAISASLIDPLKNVIAPTTYKKASNDFQIYHTIPQAGPNGRWVYRWESTSGPAAAGEYWFDVTGSSFVSP